MPRQEPIRMPLLSETIAIAMEQANRGRLAEAAAELRRHLPMHASSPELHEALGLISMRAGQADQGLYHFERAAGLGKPRAEYLSNYATALSLRGRGREATEHYRKAVKLAPGFFPAWLGLSSALNGVGEFVEAAEAARKASEIAPGRPEGWSNLALAFLRIGRTGEAVSTLQGALATLRDHPALLSLLVYALNFRPEADPAQVVEEHRRLGRVIQRLSSGAMYPTFDGPDPERPLRIGYVSAELHGNGAARLLAPLLQRHDRTTHTAHCYFSSLQGDAATRRLQGLCQHWSDVSRMSDEQLEARIRADRIDILVELDGHAPGSRIAALARRLAPVQVSWLYRNTTGVREVDWRLVDARVAPEPIEGAEKQSAIEPCFVCFDAPPDVPAVSPLPAARAGAVTFSCFCGAESIGEATIAAWAKVLGAVPGSHLTLRNAALSNAGVRDDLAARLAAAGVAKESVELLDDSGTHAEALKGYEKVDVALDATPYCGGASTMEALWMGVPVVTLEGRTQASRVGASILHAAGLGEWVARSEDDYVSLAVSLANDKRKLSEIRAGLRERVRTSPLCDADGFARRVESAYRDMWKAWCAKQ
jgi:predicted O-linked N-acetylglucosamine transferase (SPINDLY family)